MSRAGSRRAERGLQRWRGRLAGLLLAATPALAQQPATPLLPADLPIELDAAWSELDRGNDRLLFRDLRISQGDLRLAADAAEASPADFANSRWVFTGNVQLENRDARVRAERAELSFAEQRLRVIIFSGTPARFDQLTPQEGLPTAGSANRIEYDLAGNIVLMAGEAWLSDGNNQISGARIRYDLGNERVTADADESGNVRMIITPPGRDDLAPAAPQAPEVPEVPEAP